MRPSITRALLAALALALHASAAAPAAQEPRLYVNEGAIGLARKLKSAQSGLRVLHIAAHPDDEDSALIAYLSLGLGARVTYMSLTRGEGGQNLLGSEAGAALGVIRTSELLAARRADGATQLFGRMIDFGFSKSPEECFKLWGKEEIVEDIVRAIRVARPHIIICRFQGNPADGHGQHQASAIAAREAVEAAADPARFPELAKLGLAPWQAQKFYIGAFVDGPEVTLRVDTGGYDPWAGRSFASLGFRGRSMHRSQDMGMIEYETPMRGSYLILESVARGGARAKGGPESGLLDGLGLPRPATAPGELVAAPGFLSEPSKIAPAIEAARRAWPAQAPDDPEGLLDLDEALGNALGVRLEAFADAPALPAGGRIEAECRAYLPAGGALSNPSWRIEIADRYRGGLAAEPAKEAEGAGAGIFARIFAISADPAAEPARPYFRPSRANPWLYQWPENLKAGVPFEPPAATAVFSASYLGSQIELRAPVEFRRADPAFGEIREDLAVLPPASVQFDPPTLLVPLANTFQTIPLAVEARNESGAPFKGELEIGLASGASGEIGNPMHRETVELAPGQRRRVEFQYGYLGDVPSGRLSFGARWAGAAAGGAALPAWTVHRVDYRHIRPRWMCEPARGEVVYLNVKIPEGLRVGYVEGSGDRVAETLRQIGVAVDLLDAAALAARDLSQYDAVVLGIRAYEVRPELAARNERLFDYARAGGVLVAQYNKQATAEGKPIGPFPATMTSPAARVTDETAAVTLLDPASPFLSFPNKIGPHDFDGWVQERGLYFWSTWDARYKPLLACADPGEPPQQGGLLVAPMGKGQYVYAACAFFRQLPAGVEGAIRLFANLISRRRAPAS